jgi:hypothetical protein
MNFEGSEKLTQKHVQKRLQLLCLVPFWDVTTTKRLMWNNVDIWRQRLVLTIVVPIRLWVLIFPLSLN